MQNYIRHYAYNTQKAYDFHDCRVVDIVKTVDLQEALGNIDLSYPNVALLGIAFDAAVKGRKGASQGADSVRSMMDTFKTYDWHEHFDFSDKTVFDFGNVVIPNIDDMDIEQAHEIICEILGLIAKKSLVPISLGGDHSVSYPLVKALYHAHKQAKIGLVNIDAHLDVREKINGTISSGTPFRFLIDEGIIDANNFFEIGVRNFANSKYYRDYATSIGIRCISTWDIAQQSLRYWVQDIIVPHFSSLDFVYLSIDMDALDQIYAPGVSAPSPEGLSPRDILFVVKTLITECNLMGMDIVEHNPLYDINNITAHTACNFLVQGISSYYKKQISKEQ